MTPELFWVDAFAEEPLAGNPAAVVLLEAPAREARMQALAAELGLSETAFVVQGEEAFGLRWFTPTAEVDLCGHATLAAAHALWQSGRLDASAEARFDTRSGRLTARSEGELIWLDFPMTPPESAPPPEALVEALRLDRASIRFVGRSRFDWLIELDSAAGVAAVTPYMEALRAIATRGVIVTAEGGHERAPSADFVSRFFAPAAGVDEDPVTGSAHACLGPFWSERLGRERLIGYQASARGGTVHVHVAGARVHLGGAAQTVLRGHLLYPLS